jgi:tetratricopeptide (TPR) repeat protein
MGIRIKEGSIEEIKDRLASMQTDLNKIIYLESALRETGFTFEIKRFIWKELGELYATRKMFDKAAKAFSNKSGVEMTIRDKIDSCVSSAEFFSRAGKVDEADDMFLRALREANLEQRNKINLAKKNIYLVCAKDLEKKGKKATAMRFYEKLIKTDLEEVEKKEIKDKLLSTYKALGHFREAKLLEGI